MHRSQKLQGSAKSVDNQGGLEHAQTDFGAAGRAPLYRSCSGKKRGLREDNTHVRACSILVAMTVHRSLCSSQEQKLGKLRGLAGLPEPLHDTKHACNAGRPT